MPPEGVLGMLQNICDALTFGRRRWLFLITREQLFNSKCFLEQIDQPTCTTPKKQAITVPTLASIEELRTPSFDDILAKMMSEANKTKVETADINQQPCLLSPRSPLTSINWLNNRTMEQQQQCYHGKDEDCSELIESGKCRKQAAMMPPCHQDRPLTAKNCDVNVGEGEKSSSAL